MNFHIIDLVFIIVLALVLPVLSVRDFRKLRAQWRAGEPIDRAKWYVITIIVEWSLTIVVAAWWFVARRGFSTMGLAFPTDGWGWWVGGLLAVIACIVLAVQSIVVLRSPDKVENYRKQYGSLDLMAVVPTNDREARWWAALSLTAGVCEEVLYRGFLITVLASLSNTWIALGVSSVIFGLGHSYQGPGGVLKTGVVGLILGALYVVSGSLWAPILVHIVLDITAGVLMRRVGQAQVSLEPAG